MRIGVFGSIFQADKKIQIKRLFDKLEQLGASVYIESQFSCFIKDVLDFTPQMEGELSDDDFELDIALSVGGDGTFLRTAMHIGRKDIPILGINTGRLGFLADIGTTEIEDTLEEIFKNYYHVEERTLLRLTTETDRFGGYHYALNEVAILKRDTASMITIHTSLNQEYLTSYQADGLVIATPTGSTAYSMSVNGPIMLPQVNSLILSPVAPHSLNVRPLVIPDDLEISLTVACRTSSFLISLDGRSEVFPSGTQFMVSKADFNVRVIKRYGHTFYKTLREKLMWGTDVRK